MAKRYKEVHALMLRGKEDDARVGFELGALAGVFLDTYHCTSVNTHVIPSRSSYSSVERALDNLKRACSDLDSLLVVCYSGHGGLHNGKMSLSAYRKEKADNIPIPALDWYALQVGLERTISHALIILNSCASAGALGSSMTREGGRTELIAACSFNATAPGPGDKSFLKILTSELENLALLGNTFSVQQLHGNILSTIQHSSAHATLGDNSFNSAQQHPAPVHVILNGNHHRPGIALRAFKSESNDDLAEIDRYQRRAVKKRFGRFKNTIPKYIKEELKAQLTAEITAEIRAELRSEIRAEMKQEISDSFQLSLAMLD